MKRKKFSLILCWIPSILLFGRIFQNSPELPFLKDILRHVFPYTSSGEDLTCIHFAKTQGHSLWLRLRVIPWTKVHISQSLI